MRFLKKLPAGFTSLRAWLALVVLVAAWFLEDPVQAWLYAPLKHLGHLRMHEDGAMSVVPYGALVLVRLLWNVALVCLVWWVLRRPQGSFPVKDARRTRHLATGLAIGIAVMGACIGAIILMGNADVTVHPQTLVSAVGHVIGWLVFGMIGAAGEELYGRAAVLLVAERFVGWQGAVLVSGIMFFVFHLSNPGVSPIWLARLCLQGMLLAYAVYRTQSIWWSIGYHTGWNWIGAPIFGSAGSGYLNAGHLYDFAPHGSTLITGGAVGPEGSVFAFVAVVAALVLLLATTQRR